MSISPIILEQAEMTVVGAMLQDSTCCVELAVLAPEDFFFEYHKHIIAAMKSLYMAKRPIDVMTVGTELDVQGKLHDAGGTPYLLKCFRHVPTTANFESYYSTVKEASLRRKVDQIAIAMRREIVEDDPEAVIDNARQKLRDVISAKALWENMSEVMNATFDSLEARRNGTVKRIPTPLAYLNDYTGGFHPGELTIIAARTQVGKSAFALACGLHAAKNGYKVALCSREMSIEQFGDRALSADAWVDGMKIRKPEKLTEQDFVEITESANRLSQLPMLMTTKISTVEALRNEVQRAIDTTGVDLLIVDYLQIMRTMKKVEAERLRIGTISWALKDMALDFGISVVALSQLSRSEGNPTLNMLRESGSIEQDADNVWMMHCPKGREAEDINQVPLDLRSAYEALNMRGAKLIRYEIAKQRQGMTGVFYAEFDNMRYTCIDRKL